MQKVIEEDWLRREREKTEMRIMSYLTKGKQSYIARCRYCGKLLPLGSTFLCAMTVSARKCVRNTDGKTKMEEPQMAKWVEIRKGADFRAIGEKYGISPFTARLIRNKDIVGDQEIEEYLHGTLEDLHPASLMKGIPEAVDLLEQKIGENAYIRIIGDYDIDGVCATYILLRGFRAAGARVDTDIPDRMKDGYGLNRELVKRAYDAGVDTIVTCDNGIAAVQEIAYARELGMTVIVTDHHEVQEELPSARMIVNPRQADCPYPFKKLCGAAVAWKLVGAFWQQMGLPLDDLYVNS